MLRLIGRQKESTRQKHMGKYKHKHTTVNDSAFGLGDRFTNAHFFIEV